MKPTSEIAAQIWKRIEAASCDTPVTRETAIPEIKRALDNERRGWPTEMFWMLELQAELNSQGEHVTQTNLWRNAFYRLQKRVLSGHDV